MKLRVIFVFILGLSTVSCSKMNETFDALECNREAIEMSSCAIYENMLAIEEATQAIEENKRQLEAINKTLSENAGKH